MSILVAGIGNIFQGDDAFGCEVVKVLAQRSSIPDGVRVIDFGIRGLDLTYSLLDAPELTILIDTVSRGAAPGTLYTIEPDLDLDAAETDEIANAHSLDPARVLRAVKSLNGKLSRILLVGCEPGDVGGAEGSMGLTSAVSAAIEQAADIVESLIADQGRKVSV